MNTHGGFIGSPTGPESDANAGGKFQNFANNNHIYWHPNVDPGQGRQIGGAIYDKWATVNWEKSALGYPTSREFNGGRGAKGNHFQNNNEIYWTSTFGAHIVGGEIGDLWKGTGYENGYYGVPTSDEYDFDGGRRQDFEFGRAIVWKPYGFAEDYDGDDDPNRFVNEAACPGGCSDDAQGKTTTALVIPRTQYPVGIFSRSSEGQVDPDMAPTPLGVGIENCADIPIDADNSGSAWCRGTAADVAAATESEAPPIAPSTEPTPPVVPIEPSTLQPSLSEPNAPATTSPELTPGVGRPAAPTTSSDPTTTAPSTSSTTPTSAATTADPQARVIPRVQEPSTAQPTPESSDSTSQPADPSPTPAESEQSATDAEADSPVSAQRLSGLPSYCADNAQTAPANNFYGSAQYGCSNDNLAFFILKRLSNGGTVGTITARITRQMVMSYSKTSFPDSISIDIIAATQEGIGAAITGRAKCSYSDITSPIRTVPCLAETGNNSRNLVLTAIPLASSTASVSWGTFTNANQTIAADSFWQLDIVSATGAGTSLDANPTVRCDATAFMRDKKGCVFRDATPIWDLRQNTGLTDYKSHVLRAQQSGLPGSFASSSPLHRETDGAKVNSHRNASCGSIAGPRPTGKSCDEYPMASTKEGATSNMEARTFANCFPPDTKPIDVVVYAPTTSNTIGYSVCMITASQNSSAGALQSWFFTKNRVRSGDPFYVLVN